MSKLIKLHGDTLQFISDELYKLRITSPDGTQRQRDRLDGLNLAETTVNFYVERFSQENLLVDMMD